MSEIERKSLKLLAGVIGRPVSFIENLGDEFCITKDEALRAIARALSGSEWRPISDADCIAIYDAVTGANFTRDVKTPEKKVAVVRRHMPVPPEVES